MTDPVAGASAGHPFDACPDAETLCAFVRGDLPPAEEEGFLGHLAACTACRTVAATVVRESNLGEAPGAAAAPAPRVGNPPPPVRRAAPRSRLLIIAVGAVLGAALTAGFLLARTGSSLRVESLPEGTVLVDGEMRGTTPLIVGGLAPGEHEVRVRRAGFLDRVESIVAERGRASELVVGLVPADPLDGEALRVVLQAVRRSPAVATAPAPAGADADPHGTILSPRGTLRAPPSSIRVWLPTTMDDLEVSLDPAGGDPAGAQERWPVPAGVRTVVLEIPATVRAALLPGTSWKVGLHVQGGPSVDRAVFAILAGEEGRHAAEDLDRVCREFGQAGEFAVLLRAEVLLSRDFADEALGLAEGLRERNPGRREPARLGLASLERVGLAGRGPAAGWFEEFVRAGR